MAGIVDQIVQQRGVQVTLDRVTTPVYDDQDVLDLDASTIEQVTVKAIVSQPQEGHEVKDPGREARVSARFTVPSDTDIDPNRPGRPDRIIHAGTTYEVLDKTHEEHVFAPGVEKLTVSARPLPGHA